MRVLFDHNKTPLSLKQRNIKAFSRLIDLTREKAYKGPRLDDRTEAGLCRCVYTWLKLNGYKCEIQGNTVLIEFSDGQFRVVVSGTHTSHCDYPELIEGEDQIEIYNLMSFTKWYDQTF